MNRIDKTFTEEMRMRFERPEKPFRILLVEPEIPLNTGSVARLCAATGSRLVIIGKPSFSLESSDLKRAGVDYWEFVELERCESIDEFMERNRDLNIFFFSAKADRSYLDCEFKLGDALVFGRESSGLSPEIIDRFRDRLFAIPTVENIRSINLSNAVAIVLYEALRKSGCLKSTFYKV